MNKSLRIFAGVMIAPHWMTIFHWYQDTSREQRAHLVSQMTMKDFSNDMYMHVNLFLSQQAEPITKHNIIAPNASKYSHSLLTSPIIFLWSILPGRKENYHPLHLDQFTLHTDRHIGVPLPTNSINSLYFGDLFWLNGAHSVHEIYVPSFIERYRILIDIWYEAY